MTDEQTEQHAQPEPERRPWWKRFGGWLADHAPEIVLAMVTRKGGPQ
jgi:hypothetical protein